MSIPPTVRSVGMLLVAGAVILSQGKAQSRLSIEIARQDFNGNLLKFSDGTFIVERSGELYRLTANGQLERKLVFDPTHPVPEISGCNTWFKKLLAPLADGGFFAVLDFDIPYLGSVKYRLARFNGDGRIVSAHDRSYNPVSVGLELPDGRVIIGSDFALHIIPAETDFRHWAFEGLGTNGYFHGTPIWGSMRACALQGSNLVVAGKFSLSQPVTETLTLLRVNLDLLLDSSFGPALCKDISDLAVQSDGHIIACGRLADAQGVFESEISVFRLNSDGSFDRRLLQILPDDWQALAIAIDPSGDILILNSPIGSETFPTYAKLWRYYSDGTLKETIMTQHRLQCCFGHGLDRIAFFADGSFLAHWLDENDGPSGIFPHHWVGFRADGRLHSSFPPSPFDLVDVYLWATNLVRGSFQIEESTDLRLWQSFGPSSRNWGNSAERIGLRTGLRLSDETAPRFFRLLQIPDL